MNTTQSIEIPSELLHAARMSGDELKRELAVALFQQGRISFGKARELTSMTIYHFQQLLGSRGIRVHYDVNDYRQDMVTLEEQSSG